MKLMRSILLILGSMVITSLLIACSSAADPNSTSVPQLKRDVPRITAEELKKRLDDEDDILIIDTRNESQYELRHIPSAIRKPDSFDDLAHDQEIVAYCA